MIWVAFAACVVFAGVMFWLTKDSWNGTGGPK